MSVREGGRASRCFFGWQSGSLNTQVPTSNMVAGSRV